MNIDAISSRLAEARPWFEEWRSPIEFERQYLETKCGVDGNFQFNRNEAKWLLEARLISRFARLRNLQSVRLNRADPPDAFVLIENSTIPIEITEVVEPGRQRGREYQSDKPKFEEDPVEDWIFRAAKIPAALEEGIAKKKRKQYPSDTELLVYLNIDEWGIRQHEVEGVINSLLLGPTNPFLKIHVFWKDQLFDSSGSVLRDPSAAIEDDAGDEEEIFRFASS